MGTGETGQHLKKIVIDRDVIERGDGGGGRGHAGGRVLERKLVITVLKRCCER